MKNINKKNFLYLILLTLTPQSKADNSAIVSAAKIINELGQKINTLQKTTEGIQKEILKNQEKIDVLSNNVNTLNQKVFNSATQMTEQKLLELPKQAVPLENPPETVPLSAPPLLTQPTNNAPVSAPVEISPSAPVEIPSPEPIVLQQNDADVLASGTQPTGQENATQPVPLEIKDTMTMTQSNSTNGITSIAKDQKPLLKRQDTPRPGTLDNIAMDNNPKSRPIDEDTKSAVVPQQAAEPKKTDQTLAQQSSRTDQRAVGQEALIPSRTPTKPANAAKSSVTTNNAQSGTMTSANLENKKPDAPVDKFSDSVKKPSSVSQEKVIPKTEPAFEINDNFQTKNKTNTESKTIKQDPKIEPDFKKPEPIKAESTELYESIILGQSEDKQKEGGLSGPKNSKIDQTENTKSAPPLPPAQIVENLTNPEKPTTISQTPPKPSQEPEIKKGVQTLPKQSAPLNPSKAPAQTDAKVTPTPTTQKAEESQKSKENTAPVIEKGNTQGFNLNASGQVGAKPGSTTQNGPSVRANNLPNNSSQEKKIDNRAAKPPLETQPTNKLYASEFLPESSDITKKDEKDEKNEKDKIASPVLAEPKPSPDSKEVKSLEKRVENPSEKKVDERQGLDLNRPQRFGPEVEGRQNKPTGNNKDTPKSTENFNTNQSGQVRGTPGSKTQEADPLPTQIPSTTNVKENPSSKNRGPNSSFQDQKPAEKNSKTPTSIPIENNQGAQKNSSQKLTEPQKPEKKAPGQEDLKVNPEATAQKTNLFNSELNKEGETATISDKSPNLSESKESQITQTVSIDKAPSLQKVKSGLNETILFQSGKAGKVGKDGKAYDSIKRGLENENKILDETLAKKTKRSQSENGPQNRGQVSDNANISFGAQNEVDIPTFESSDELNDEKITNDPLQSPVGSPVGSPAPSRRNSLSSKTENDNSDSESNKSTPSLSEGIITLKDAQDILDKIEKAPSRKRKKISESFQKENQNAKITPEAVEFFRERKKPNATGTINDWAATLTVGQNEEVNLNQESTTSPLMPQEPTTLENQIAKNKIDKPSDEEGRDTDYPSLKDSQNSTVENSTKAIDTKSVNEEAYPTPPVITPPVSPVESLADSPVLSRNNSLSNKSESANSDSESNKSNQSLSEEIITLQDAEEFMEGIKNSNNDGNKKRRRASFQNKHKNKKITSEAVEFFKGIEDSPFKKAINDWASNLALANSKEENSNEKSVTSSEISEKSEINQNESKDSGLNNEESDSSNQSEGTGSEEEDAKEELTTSSGMSEVQKTIAQEIKAYTEKWKNAKDEKEKRELTKKFNIFLNGVDKVNQEDLDAMLVFYKDTNVSRTVQEKIQELSQSLTENDLKENSKENKKNLENFKKYFERGWVSTNKPTAPKDSINIKNDINKYIDSVKQISKSPSKTEEQKSFIRERKLELKTSLNQLLSNIIIDRVNFDDLVNLYKATNSTSIKGNIENVIQESFREKLKDFNTQINATEGIFSYLRSQKKLDDEDPGYQ